MLPRAIAIALTMAMPVTAAAQAAQTTDDSVTALGKVTVTGMMTPSIDVSPTAPVLTVSRAQIDATGLKSVQDVLTQLTVAGTSQNLSDNFGGTGKTTVELRHLGSERVLVLVNGRRWATSPDGDVDLTTLPLAIVDHIEVLKGGDSARYGSGAMAGIINLVTRQDFKGVQARAYAGEYMKGGQHDGKTQAYDFTIGSTSDRGSVLLNASRYSSGTVRDLDRAISAVPRYGTGTTRGSSTLAAGNFILRDPITGKATPYLTIKPGASGTSPSDFGPYDTKHNLFNYQGNNYLLSPSETNGLYAQADYNITPDITFYTSVLYQKRQSHQTSGPSEIKIGADSDLSVNISASNPYNPFGYDLNSTGTDPNLLLYKRQLSETNGRQFRQDVDTYYFTGGFAGQLPGPLDKLHWDVNYTFNKSNFNSLRQGLVNAPLFEYALGAADQCPSALRPQCVPLNLFGGEGSITPQMLDYLIYTGQRSITNQMRNYTARVDGPLFDLPAGPLALTLGYEYRQVDGSDVPDAISQTEPQSLSPAGNLFGDFQSPASGGYNVSAAFVGLNVPLLADLPFAKQLDLDLAQRHADFNTFGSINASRASLNWQPTSEWLVRANWSKDFRAPNIREMYGLSNNGATATADPCSQYTASGVAPNVAAACAAAGVPADYTQLDNLLPTLTGANRNLQPETSMSRGLGVVFSPSAIPSLEVNADYWRIKVHNTIATLDPLQILRGCYAADQSAFCAAITRAADGAIRRIDDRITNTGSVETDGLDVGIKYVLPSTGIGRFGVNWQTTYLRNYTETLTNFGPGASAPIVTERAGHEYGSAGGYPLFRSNLNLSWALGNWSANWIVRYTSDMSEECNDRTGGALSLTNLGLCSYPNEANNKLSRNRIGAATYHDAQVNYDFASAGTTVTFGIRNVFDKDPPVSMTASDSFDTHLYPIPGRFPYLSVQVGF